MLKSEWISSYAFLLAIMLTNVMLMMGTSELQYMPSLTMVSPNLFSRLWERLVVTSINLLGFDDDMKINDLTEIILSSDTWLVIMMIIMMIITLINSLGLLNDMTDHLTDWNHIVNWHLSGEWKANLYWEPSGRVVSLYLRQKQWIINDTNELNIF